MLPPIPIGCCCNESKFVVCVGVAFVCRTSLEIKYIVFIPAVILQKNAIYIVESCHLEWKTVHTEREKIKWKLNGTSRITKSIFKKFLNANRPKFREQQSCAEIGKKLYREKSEEHLRFVKKENGNLKFIVHSFTIALFLIRGFFFLLLFFSFFFALVNIGKRILFDVFCLPNFIHDSCALKMASTKYQKTEKNKTKRKPKS